MKKRKFRILLIIYTAALILSLSAYSAVSAWCIDRTEMLTEAMYRRSFEETAAHMGSMSRVLEQCRYATGSMCTQLCCEAFGEAEAALSALSTMPFSTVEMEETAGFLNTASDFLLQLCGGERREFDDEVREDICSISDSAKGLSENIFDLRDSVNSGELTVDSRAVHLRNITGEEEVLLSDSFYDMEEDFTSPEIKNYSGRYAENTVETVSTDGEWSISEEEARTALPAGMEFENLGKLDIKTGDGESAKCFEFVAQDGDRLVKIYVDIHTARQRQISVS